MHPIEQYLDNTYPQRHTWIHKSCCGICPLVINARQGREEEGWKEIRSEFTKEEIINNHLETCQIRPFGLCKGMASYMGVKQQDLEDK